jgi:hypothetical protein
VSKPPTPQAVSAPLRKAGFTRAVTAIRGGCSGFVVTADRARDGSVRVRYRSWSMGAVDQGAREWITRYAKAITGAGWTVDAGTYELVVTAPEPAEVTSVKPAAKEG